MTRPHVFIFAGSALLAAALGVPVTTHGAAQASGRTAPAGQPQANAATPVQGGATWARRPVGAATGPSTSAGPRPVANVVVDPKEHPEAILPRLLEA
jgi:hypothetical protein